MLDSVFNDRKIVIAWGFFGMIEFLSLKVEIFKENIKMHWI